MHVAVGMDKRRKNTLSLLYSLSSYQNSHPWSIIFKVTYGLGFGERRDARRNRLPLKKSTFLVKSIESLIWAWRLLMFYE